MKNPLFVIKDFENGLLTQAESIELFSDLLKTGLIWNCNDIHIKLANYLVKQGFLDYEGNVLIKLEDRFI